ncbi:MAG: aminotransferase class III-fold pyridoxal phosphate-dependent enzyme, partial [Chitinophagaceae bacterium]|nr:aminotransferase class III-fold pyridoxal phosphate-dependent enzyme [Chitinophagaceae bacterium]
YAKAMSNGIPFATVVGHDNVMTAADESFISSSYWTDGIGTAAALAVLKKMECENISDAVWAKGVALQEQLREIAMKYVSCGLVVGGMPASPTFTFTSSCATAVRKLFITRMQEEGFLVAGIFYLMHAHKEQHLHRFAEAFEQTLQLIEESIESGIIETENSKAFQQGFTRLA